MKETTSVLDLGGFCVWAQLHPTLDGSVDCSPPDSSACGIFQARMLEWGALSYSRGSSPPMNPELLSLASPALAGGFFTTNATREALTLEVKHFKTKE